MNNIGFTIPFDHAPASLPEGSPGYTGTGRNGSFKAAGVTLTTWTSQTSNYAEVILANLTSRGSRANQAVVMPPTVMDQLAVRWLSLHGHSEVIIAGLVGRAVESLLSLEASDNDTSGPRPVDPGARGTIIVAACEQGIFNALVTFGDHYIVVPVIDFFDPAKWRL